MKWAHLMAAFVLCVGVRARAQDAPERPLGDVARQTRKEHLVPHPPSRQLVNEEEDGPDTTGVWRMHCWRMPCSDLTITLPKDTKWTRGKDEPRPVTIALPGVEEDANRVIRIYAAESLQQAYGWVDTAAQQFLQGWFSRPEFFGKAAHIVRQQQIILDSSPAEVTQFTVTPGAAKYRGISVVAGSGNGYHGFACTFREEDAKAAESVCDAVVTSARSQALNPPAPRVNPQPVPYDPPEYLE